MPAANVRRRAWVAPSQPAGQIRIAYAIAASRARFGDGRGSPRASARGMCRLTTCTHALEDPARKSDRGLVPHPWSDR